MAEVVFEMVLGVGSDTNDVYNANEILHFVQNDTLFYQNDIESRQWILCFALNDREKKPQKKYAPLRELSKTEGDIFEKPVIITHRPADTSLKGRQTIEKP